jgi:hypothetical protein
MANLLHCFLAQVALYLDRLMSPSLSPPLLPAAISLTFRPNPPSQIRTIGSHQPVAGAVGSSDLACTAIPHDARRSVTQNRASCLLLTSAGQWQKSLAMTECEFCLAVPSRRMTRPHQDRNEHSGLEGLGAVEGAGMGFLARRYRTSRPSERIPNSALCCRR